jgi:hypothetical protein
MKYVRPDIYDLKLFFGSVVIERNVTDPRDGVFGVQGMFPQFQEQFKSAGLISGYSIAPVEIFQHYARFLITSTGRLDVLLCRYPSLLEGLPSWVPEWVLYPNGTRRSVNDMDLRDIKVNTDRFNYRLSPNGDQLSAYGIEIGTVEHLIPSPESCRGLINITSQEILE